MQSHTVEVGEVLVIDGVRVTILAVIGGEVHFGVGESESEATPEVGPSVWRLLASDAWLHQSPN